MFQKHGYLYFNKSNRFISTSGSAGHWNILIKFNPEKNGIAILRRNCWNRAFFVLIMEVNLPPLYFQSKKEIVESPITLSRRGVTLIQHLSLFWIVKLVAYSEFILFYILTLIFWLTFVINYRLMFHYCERIDLKKPALAAFTCLANHRIIINDQP